MLTPLIEVYQAMRLRWTEEHAPTVITIATTEDPHPPNWCRYCGKPWRMWRGSRLDGHAACYVPRAFYRELRTFLTSHPEVTFGDVAIALDVTIAVVRRWWAEGGRP